MIFPPIAITIKSLPILPFPGWRRKCDLSRGRPKPYIQRWVNTLVDLSRRISSGMDIEEILLMSMESVYNLTEPEVAVLGMWEPEHEQFRIKYQVTGQGLEKTDFVFSSEDLKVVSEGVVFPIQQNNIGHVFPILLKTNEQVIGGLWIGRAQMCHSLLG
jgi:hypothetical protein